MLRGKANTPTWGSTDEEASKERRKSNGRAREMGGSKEGKRKHLAHTHTQNKVLFCSVQERRKRPE